MTSPPSSSSLKVTVRGGTPTAALAAECVPRCWGPSRKDLSLTHSADTVDASLPAVAPAEARLAPPGTPATSAGARLALPSVLPSEYASEYLCLPISPVLISSSDPNPKSKSSDCATEVGERAERRATVDPALGEPEKPPAAPVPGPPSPRGGCTSLHLIVLATFPNAIGVLPL